ncbi:hypothetical protein [Niabella aurantiaca]|uniref:hypothetical protein n=1 Tax=Niabella aurantiaca TaxID=379900 RepID=UPI00036D7387|nr:hypothetical protein [Niabella aurantiaca]
MGATPDKRSQKLVHVVRALSLAGMDQPAGNAVKYSHKKEETVIHVGCKETTQDIIYFVKGRGQRYQAFAGRTDHRPV